MKFLGKLPTKVCARLLGGSIAVCVGTEVGVKGLERKELRGDWGELGCSAAVLEGVCA